jgi:nucleotide-binding universal stress UspA family protein
MPLATTAGDQIKGNTYVIAIDGSKYSKAVLELTAKMVKPIDFVYLYHVFVKVPFVKPSEQQERRAHEMLDQAGAVLEGKVQMEKVVEVSSDPRKAICEFAERKMAKCVFMGTRGLGGLQRLMMGSTSEYVLHHSDDAVCIVHSEPTGDNINYMVCVDGSAHSQRAANWVANMARGRDQVTLLHAFQAPSRYLENVFLPDPDAIVVPSNIENPNYEQELEAAEARAATLLNAVKHNFAAALEENPEKSAIHVRTASQASIDVRDSIMRKMKEFNADIIVMGSRGENNFAKMVFGSVSSYVVRNVESHAVMVVH